MNKRTPPGAPLARTRRCIAASFCVAVLAFVHVSSTNAAMPATAPAREIGRARADEPVIHVVDGGLSVELKDTPVEQALAAIGRATAITVTLDAPAHETVTATFIAQPIEVALRRILGTRSFLLTYATDGSYPARCSSSADQTSRETRCMPRLTALRVLASSDAAPRPDATNGVAAETSTKAGGTVEVPAHASVAVASLVSDLLTRPEETRRADAATALGRSWSPDAINPLTQAVMDDADASVRLAAVEALGRVWDDAVVDPLALALLGDPDQSVREEAAHALGETWNDAAVGPLVEALLDDPQWQVRERAARALGETGSADAVTPLTKALRDPDASVRESVTRALAEIGPDPR